MSTGPPGRSRNKYIDERMMGFAQARSAAVLISNRPRGVTGAVAGAKGLDEAALTSDSSAACPIWSAPQAGRSQHEKTERKRKKRKRESGHSRRDSRWQVAVVHPTFTHIYSTVVCLWPSLGTRLFNIRVH